jgi:hypothetical protein
VGVEPGAGKAVERFSEGMVGGGGIEEGLEGAPAVFGGDDCGVATAAADFELKLSDRTGGTLPAPLSVLSTAMLAPDRDDAIESARGL